MYTSVRKKCDILIKSQRCRNADTTERIEKFELDKALARAHILEGLKIALDNIDEVININTFFI